MCRRISATTLQTASWHQPTAASSIGYGGDVRTRALRDSPTASDRAAGQGALRPTVGTTRARVRSGFFGGSIPLEPHALDGRVNGLAAVYNPSRGVSTILRGSFVAAEQRRKLELVFERARATGEAQQYETFRDAPDGERHYWERWRRGLRGSFR